MDLTRTNAVAYLANLPIHDPRSLVDVEVEVPPPGPRDLAVEVYAVSVNPVDVKVRASSDPGACPRSSATTRPAWSSRVGSDVELFEVADEVYYAGSIARSGSNAGLQLVDERVVGHKPSSLDFAEAAALPLTTITAWEALFDKLGLERDPTGTLLVLGAAGGVGSMVVQLARRLTGLTVIATASRPESIAWARDMGAHHVVDHHRLIAEVRRVAPGGVDDVFTRFRPATSTPSQRCSRRTARSWPSTIPRASTCSPSRPRASPGIGSATVNRRYSG
jgi:NADPH:quinone reductase